ncbi:MAG: hypothetical protein AAF447_27560 [Myxococcota bacterium]
MHIEPVVTLPLFLAVISLPGCADTVTVGGNAFSDAFATSTDGGGRRDGGPTRTGGDDAGLGGGDDAGLEGGATGPRGVRELEAGGIARTYELVLPDAPAGAPVVFLFHGQGGSSRELLGIADPPIRTPWSLWLDLAAEENLILVVPDALHADGTRTWNDCRPQTPERFDDVGFFDALLDHVLEEHGADRENVFATGFSNGGQLVLRLAEERPERLKAIAPISASMSDDPASPCVRSDVPLSALFINGSMDAILPYDGGEMWGGQGRVLELWDVAEIFVARNGITESPTVWYGAASFWFWGSQDGPAVQLLPIWNGGHVEPSIAVEVDLPAPIFGPQSRDVEMTEIVWGFFGPLVAP